METVDKIKDEDIEFSLLDDLSLSFVKGNVFLPMQIESCPG
jgi:hypothetical protein